MIWMQILLLIQVVRAGPYSFSYHQESKLQDYENKNSIENFFNEVEAQKTRTHILKHDKKINPKTGLNLWAFVTKYLDLFN